MQDAIGLIGLGLVGNALCERFLRAGFPVVGLDIDAEACARSRALGAEVASSSEELRERCARIVLSLPGPGAVLEVLDGDDGLLDAASGAGGLSIVDTTTGDPATARALASRALETGSVYLDACIVGSSVAVREGSAVVVVGGPEDTVRASRELLDCFAARTFRVGPAGRGTEAKLVVNLVLGLHRLVLAEGLALAEALDLDLPELLEVLRASVAYSRVMDTKGPKMLAGDYRAEARLDQHLKDVRLIESLAERAGIPLRLAAVHRGILEAARDAGRGDQDNCAIFEVLRRKD